MRTFTDPNGSLGCPARGCGARTQISGSGSGSSSSYWKFSAPAPIILNCLGSGSTALMRSGVACWIAAMAAVCARSFCNETAVNVLRGKDRMLTSSATFSQHTVRSKHHYTTCECFRLYMQMTTRGYRSTPTSCTTQLTGATSTLSLSCKRIETSIWAEIGLSWKLSGQCAR